MPIRLPAADGCVFDLDGTLVDSLRDIAETLNECLELLGLSPRPLPGYRYMVGEGFPTLCQRALGDTHLYLVPRLTELARARYRTRMLQYTRPYTAVPEMVARLRARGLPLGVLSNKPHELTVRIVKTLWPDNPFACVQGYTNEHHRKPDPSHLLRICGALGTAPARTWLVGDTPTDIATARAGGAVPIAVTWGFRPRAELAAAGAEYIVDHPDELD